MKVFILTEGGSEIGFGHLTRCVALEQAFALKGISVEFLVSGDASVKSLLAGKHYQCIDWLQDDASLLYVLRNADVVIVDSYLAKSLLYKKISQAVTTVVYLDDNKRLKYPPGMVVNGAIYAHRLRYPRNSRNTYLLGTAYSLLRREFWRVSQKKIKKNAATIMVTFGGDDIRNMTSRIAGMLAVCYPHMKKKIIVGKGFCRKNQEAIERIKETEKNTECVYFPNAEAMRKIMMESDIAISGGGQTLYELARIGIPTIAVAVAKNQLNNVQGWATAGSVMYAGWWRSIGEMNVLRDKVHTLLTHDSARKKMAGKMQAFVDGRGAQRVVDTIIKKAAENHG